MSTHNTHMESTNKWNQQIMMCLPLCSHTPEHCDEPACKAGHELCPDKDVCAPIPPDAFELIEIVCISFFTVDYGIRVLIAGAMPARYISVMDTSL